MDAVLVGMLGCHEVGHLLSIVKADCALRSAAVMSTKPTVVPALDMIMSAALLAGTCLTLKPAVCRGLGVSKPESRQALLITQVPFAFMVIPH